MSKLKSLPVLALLAMSALACDSGSDSASIDPRCEDICDAAGRLCGDDEEDQCEESCQASFVDFSPTYRECILQRAYVTHYPDEIPDLCYFSVDDIEECARNE